MSEYDVRTRMECLQLAIQTGAGPNSIDMAKQIEEYIRGPKDGGTVLRIAAKAQKKGKVA